MTTIFETMLQDAREMADRQRAETSWGGRRITSVTTIEHRRACILRALENGPKTNRQLADEIGSMDAEEVRRDACKLSGQGLLKSRRIKAGRLWVCEWRLA